MNSGTRPVRVVAAVALAAAAGAHAAAVPGPTRHLAPGPAGYPGIPGAVADGGRLWSTDYEHDRLVMFGG